LKKVPETRKKAMESNLRTLSPQESKVVLRLEWEEQRAVRRSEIVRILGGDSLRASKVIHSLTKKRWLERIAPGRYLLIPATRGPEGVPETNALGIGKHLIEPYYFGYTTAAAYYRFTPRSRNTVWIVTPKHARDRTIRGTSFRFVNLVGRKFFGHAATTVYGEEVNMADPEKTVLDCVDKIRKAGGLAEVARIIVRAAPRLDWEKLAGDAERFGSVAVIQRLGYLATRAGVEIPARPRQRLRARVKANSRSFLDPSAGRNGQAHYDAEWRILINVPEGEILSDL
jgi:predicted transcriptional regulator of viral defense system